jgi:hypothetical protein
MTTSWIGWATAAGRRARPEKSSRIRVAITIRSSAAAKAAPVIGSTLGKYGSDGALAREKMRASAGR